MFGYLLVVLLATGLFWLDPLLQAVAPSWAPPPSRSEAPVLRRTPRPPINESLLALEEAGDADSCAPDAYTVRLFSKAPLVLYVENFLSRAERQHLLEISSPLYEPSTVTDDGSTVRLHAGVRDSAVALVPRTPVVRCLEARARRLQGWRDDLWIERLRVQRYAAPSGHYGYHFDWSRSGAATGGWGRVSSLMVFVDDGELDGEDGAAATHTPLVGGGTAFPRLPRRSTDSRWCQFVECGGDEEAADEEAGTGREKKDGDEQAGTGREKKDGDEQAGTEGVVFRPLPGHAVFWENFRPDGTGRAYNETWHAGLRVRQGVKVGLNIWSWGRVD